MSTNLTPSTPRDWIRHITVARAAQNEVENIGHELPWETRRSVYMALESAMAELCLDFELAPWGQNGNCFVTDRRNTWADDRARFRELFVQGRLVAIFTSQTGKVELIPEAEAEALFSQRRADARGRESAYKAERQILIGHLVAGGHRQLASFGEWIYLNGQKGGFFYRPGRFEEIRVAAESALRAVVAEEGDEHLLEAQWDRQVHGARY